MATSDPLIGKTLNGVQITELIGKGGMASVYKAHQPSLNRNVAVKVLAPYLAHDKDFVRRFEQEARSTANLTHPNVVNIFDIGESEGYHFIVMEYVDGVSLKEILDKNGAFPEPRAWHIISQVASALDYAHSRGVIHRDVKPANILVSDKDHVTLTDFGIAKAIEGSRLTQTGTILGTPEYMSPEQATGGPVDARSDIYSLGVVAYEMLGGRPPFTAPTPSQVIEKVIHSELPPLRRIDSHISPASENAIGRALAKNPNARYATAMAMVHAATSDPGPAPAPRAKQPTFVPPPKPIQPVRQQGGNSLVLIALILVAVLFLGLAAFLFFKNPFQASPTATVVAGAVTPNGGTLVRNTPVLLRDQTAQALANQTVIAQALQTHQAENAETGTAGGASLPTVSPIPIETIAVTDTVVPPVTAVTAPATRPTRRVPTANPFAALPPDVYLTTLQPAAKPSRGQDLIFVATFENTTNETRQFEWEIRAWKEDGGSHGFGNSQHARLVVPAGHSEIQTPIGLQVKGGGGCERFYVVAFYINLKDNGEIAFHTPNQAGPLRYYFEVC